MLSTTIRQCLLAAILLVGAAVIQAQISPLTPDIPPKFETPTASYDYVKRDVMIPMRDGVRLHTVIVVPKGARNAPMIMTRTPYNATRRTERTQSTHMLAILPEGDEVFAADGYIRVFQDVRGKYGSEGEYVMTRPLKGPLNESAVDHSTDAYDTIEWLVKNVPESNGKVGMLGSSYEGFTVVMALVNPHPALKVATMWIQGLWDQEDMWGAIHCYLAVEPKDADNTKNFLVMGPWRHSGVNYNGTSLGPLKWEGDTALQFRRDVLKPFFDQYLKDGAPKTDTPPVFIYNTGENHWDRFKSWPQACEAGCAVKSKPLYLTPGFGLSFNAPAASKDGASDYDEYVSDPAKPVPYISRPVRVGDSDAWRRW